MGASGVSTGPGMQRAEPVVQIRLAQPGDQDAVTRIFQASELFVGSQETPDDPGDDIFDLRKHYDVGASDAPTDGAGEGSDAALATGLPSEEHPAVLWVAEHPVAGVVGMVGLRHMSDDVVEMRRLRVESAFRGQGIGSALVRHATKVCAERSYLKVQLDTYIERASAIRLFERAGFVLARTKPSENGLHARLDFYLDLYRDQPGKN